MRQRTTLVEFSSAIIEGRSNAFHSKSLQDSATIVQSALRKLGSLRPYDGDVPHKLSLDLSLNPNLTIDEGSKCIYDILISCRFVPMCVSFMHYVVCAMQ